MEKNSNKALNNLKKRLRLRFCLIISFSIGLICLFYFTDILVTRGYVDPQMKEYFLKHPILFLIAITLFLGSVCFGSWIGQKKQLNALKRNIDTTQIVPEELDNGENSRSS